MLSQQDSGNLPASFPSRGAAFLVPDVFGEVRSAEAALVQLEGATTGWSGGGLGCTSSAAAAAHRGSFVGGDMELPRVIPDNNHPKADQEEEENRKAR